MPITKATASAVAPAAKGDLVVGSATNDAAVLGVGSNDQVLTADSSTATGLKWATPASGSITFTQRLAATGVQWNKFAYNGTNLYVAVGGSGQLYSSTDGQTWTSRTSGFGSNSIIDVAFGNGLFVAVGNNGTITTSTDGTTWTARTANMGTNVIRRVIYANSTWVAIGNGGGTTNTGGITYSTDGLTWTRKNQSVSVGTSYQDIIWNGTNWIIGTDSGTNNILYSSTISGTYTVANIISGFDILVLLYDGTRTIIITSEGGDNVSYSTSTTLATTAKYETFGPLPNSHKANSLYDSKFYWAGGWFGRMTPTSSAYVNEVSVLGISPTSYPTQTNTLASRFGAFWVGSTGYIFGDSQGRIYTSF